MGASDELRTELLDGVFTATLNRPDALNALTPTMLTALAGALEQAADDAAVRVVVLTGAGRAFSAGVDLKALNGAPIVDGMVGDLLDLPARRVTTTLAEMPKPAIAKINGHCFTGALELALACDLVYIAEQAKLGDTHAKWGLRPTWGMSQRLPRRVGMAVARELAMTAMTFNAAQARDWGLANEIAPADALDALVGERITAILANSADAIAAYKDLWRAAEALPLAEGLRYEAETGYALADSNERLAEFLK